VEYHAVTLALTDRIVRIVQNKYTKNGSNKKFSVVELFSGCGGFSHGFQRTGAFEVICGSDLKRPALETFRRNHLNSEGRPPAIIESDIREVEIAEIQSILTKRGVGTGELDCLIGGPPCQGFSQLRRSKEREQNRIVRFRGYNRLDQDPRNDLVLRFLEIAAVLRPKVVVIENVPQMMSHVHNGIDGGLPISIEKLLEELDYEVKDEVLNAADFGVPQIRQRVFIMASRVGTPSFPEATHGDPLSKGFDKKSIPWVTVGQAISDLPRPPLGPTDSLGNGPVSLYCSERSSRYAKAMRSTRFPYNHITREYEESVLSLIRNMRPGETWDEASARMQLDFAKIIQSEKRDTESLDQCQQRLVEKGLIVSTFYKKYYWSAYTRLDPKRPALTITANANFLGSGRFTHPEQDRGITIREAARLQSFEDDFTFLTSANGKDLTTNIGTGLDMIGEAVPPLLAEAIAGKVATLLRRNITGHSKKFVGEKGIKEKSVI
jgi:DNA (cytosine-5)-methyltransferase 1